MARAFLFILLIISMLAIEQTSARRHDRLRQRFKHLHPKVLSQLGSQACMDITEVPRSQVKFQGTVKASQMNPSVKFWTSPTVDALIKRFEESPVVLKGRPNTTLKEVFAVLRQAKCYPYLFGGPVRDQFLARAPKDADIQIDCTLNKFMDLCTKTWGKENCIRTKEYPAHLGHNDILDVVSLYTPGEIYDPLVKLEYRVNDVAYDTNGNNIIIDLTGEGIPDVCRAKPRICLPTVDQKTWLKDNPKAPYRFWKLRSKNLVPCDANTLKFIVNSALARMETPRNNRTFEKFYCNNAADGDYDEKTNKCTNCNKKKTASYDKVLKEDFGPDYKIVTEHYPDLSSCK